NAASEILHAAHISREYLTMRRNRHFELELFVTRIRHIAAEVEIHSASSKSRPAGPQGERVFSGNLRHTFRAHHPDRVSGQQVFVFVHFGWKPIGKITHTLEKSNRRLERQATNAEVRGHHALAAHHREQPRAGVSLEEAVKKNAQSPTSQGRRRS